MSSAEKVDFIILGTGLYTSIASAALAKAGKHIVHIDKNGFYGENSGCLSIPEFCSFIRDNPDFKNVKAQVDERLNETSTALAEFKEGTLRDIQSTLSIPTLDALRKIYANLPLSHPFINLNPYLIHSTSPLLQLLVDSKIYKYVEFKLLERMILVDGDEKGIPMSKEDLFLSNEIGLVEKRRVMKFFRDVNEMILDSDETEEGVKILEQQDQEKPFMEYLKEQVKLSDQLIKFIMYGITLQFQDESVIASATTKQSIEKMKSFFKSLAKKFSPTQKTPFLTNSYGLLSEIIQGFVRYSAIHGTCFRLRSDIKKLEKLDGEWLLELSDGALYKSSNVLMSSQYSHLLDLKVEKIWRHKWMVVHETKNDEFYHDLKIQLSSLRIQQNQVFDGFDVSCGIGQEQREIEGILFKLSFDELEVVAQCEENGLKVVQEQVWFDDLWFGIDETAKNVPGYLKQFDVDLAILKSVQQDEEEE